MGTVSEERTLADRLSGAFVTLGALVIGAFVLTAVAYGVCWGWVTPAVERSRTAIDAHNSSFAAMIDKENGLRAYLLTHDVAFLEPYIQAEAALTDAYVALDANASSVPEVAAAILGTRLAELRWREGWAAMAADVRVGGIAPPAEEGRLLFDAYRKSASTLGEVLERRRAFLARWEERVIAARVTLDLAVFAAVLLLVIRQHHRLHDAIVVPVALLLGHIRRIRDGEIVEEVRNGAAPRELAELGDGLNEMTRALLGARKSAESRDLALRDHSARLRQILDASREFAESLNLAYVVGAVRESTAKVGGYQRVIVWLLDDDHKRLTNADEREVEGSAAVSVAMGTGVAGRAAKSGRISFEGPAGQVRFDDAGPSLVSAIAIPLIVGARVVGALEARHAEPHLLTREVVEVLEMLSTHAATAIESARLHEVIEARSQMDALTRLLNRRRLDEDLDAECKRCDRYKRPMSLVMLDIDHFKAYNDTYGHPRADVALQEVAHIIAGSVRTTDTAYRYGGEEFCILMRETSAIDAMHLAERVRQRIENRFASAETGPITASFGVAGFDAASPTPHMLLEAADAAMYESKRAGRNRVVLSSRPPGKPSLVPSSGSGPPISSRRGDLGGDGRPDLGPTSRPVAEGR
jgi:diguanylate cyclase (GGDEF)-like protein